MAEPPRVIVHADMDAFFAAIEQLDDPTLRGKPLLIGGPIERGVVATASYEARPYGVGSAMPMALAVRRVPGAIVLRPRFERYKEVSAQVMAVFADFAPEVEALSIDEAFLDATTVADRHPGPAALGRALKDAVREATGGLTVSVGISGTKFVAKVASDYHKPDGLTVVAPADAAAFLAPLPVSRLWGAGPKTAARLEALGLHTIGDVARAALTTLAPLGRQGEHFKRLALGDDPRPVVSHRDPKSIGWERTLTTDIRGAAAIAPLLHQAAEAVAERLRRRQWRAAGVRVKLKTADFTLMTRQLALPAPTDDPARLADAAVRLIEHFDLDHPFRLVGLTGYDLAPAGAPIQLPLFPPGALEPRA
ncbi:MAG: DNA polymerase IV [bacterium]